MFKFTDKKIFIILGSKICLSVSLNKYGKLLLECMLHLRFDVRQIGCSVYQLTMINLPDTLHYMSRVMFLGRVLHT